MHAWNCDIFKCAKEAGEGNVSSNEPLTFDPEVSSIGFRLGLMNSCRPRLSWECSGTTTEPPGRV